MGISSEEPFSCCRHNGHLFLRHTLVWGRSCLHGNGISGRPIRSDLQDRKAHVAVGTHQRHGGNLTIINGGKTGNAPFLGRISRSWGAASRKCLLLRTAPLPLIPLCSVFSIVISLFLLRGWKFSNIKIALKKKKRNLSARWELSLFPFTWKCAPLRVLGIAGRE